MRRTLPAVLTAAFLTPLLVAAPADAGQRSPVTFDDTRVFAEDNPPGDATTSLAECATAVTVDRRAKGLELRPRGVFIGIRDFQCGGGTGFVVRLTATFGEGGSFGRWSIVDSYGDLSGLSGSGTLVGEPIDGGIIDHYSGWVTMH